MNKNKVGIMIISEYFYQNEWPSFSEIFKYFRPYKIEKSGNFYEFYGHSDAFDEIEYGERIPNYEVHCIKAKTGSQCFDFKRLKQD
jgi:hypothetical protein